MGWCWVTCKGDGEGCEAHGELGEDCAGLYEGGVKMTLGHADVMDKGLKHIGNGVSLVLVQMGIGLEMMFTMTETVPTEACFETA